MRFSLIYVWSFQNEVASLQTVLDHLLLALFLCFRIYLLSVDDLQLDTSVISWGFLFFYLAVLLAAASLQGVPSLNQQLLPRCCVFSFLGHNFVRGTLQDLFRLQISRVHAPSAGCWGGRMMGAVSLGVCFPAPHAGLEGSEITAPVNSLNIFHECYNKF